MNGQRGAMSLALFYLPCGLEGAWRRDDSDVEQLYGLGPPLEAVRRAERAKLDAFVFGDNLSFKSNGANPESAGYDPITATAALCTATSRIGLIPTASTTFTEPFHLARSLASIDFLSDGRAGWNIVTSRVGAENFTMEKQPPAPERYARAQEYLQVVTALWDAWAANAVVNDRNRGIWADTSRIAPIDHVGEHFSVRGPLSAPRSPQGRPVLMQAGQSAGGRALGARWAEVVYTAQTDADLAREFYESTRRAVAANGRDPERVRILPGLNVIVGATEAEARRLDDELFELADPRSRRDALSLALGGVAIDDLGPYDVIPEERLQRPDAVADADRTLFWQGSSSRYANYYDAAVRRKLTVRELAQELVPAGGHGRLVGAVEQVADEMERWFRTRACDGFVIAPELMPDGLAAICDWLVPELQRRGLFRTDYRGLTLREHLNEDVT
jgi:FMN-dependent oxidoreductase (nitrilotriacetate monooxygenase family)